MRLKTATLVALLALIPMIAGGCGLISARSGARNKRAAALYARSYKARAAAANQASLSDPGTAKLYKELVAEAPRYLSAVRFLMELKHFWALYDDEASGLKRQVIAHLAQLDFLAEASVIDRRYLFRFGPALTRSSGLGSRAGHQRCAPTQPGRCHRRTRRWCG